MYLHERRSAKRFPLELQGYAIINGCNIDLKTRDVSPGGSMVKFATHTALRKGMKLLVLLDIGFMGRAVVCRACTCDNCTLYSIRFDRFDAYSDLILIAYLIKHERNLLKGPTIQ